MKSNKHVIVNLMFISLVASLVFAALPKRAGRDAGSEGMAIIDVLLKTDPPYEQDLFVLHIIKRSSRWVPSLPPASRGVGVFEVDGNFSATQTTVTRVFEAARRLRMASRHVVVVVVSDDLPFLSVFAEWSLKGRLLVWSTRLLVLTRLLPQRVPFLHKALSFSNSLLLTPGHGRGRGPGVQVSVVSPYSEAGSQPLVVATWTAQRGLTLTSHLPLFPEKFQKFPRQTQVTVAMEQSHLHKVVMEDDLSSPGEKRISFEGYLVTALDYMAQGINFTYMFKRPPDGQWGNKQPDGTVTGMVGQVFREEAHIGLGIFAINPSRTQVVEFTLPMLIASLKVFAGRKSLEVDPWGFFLPLSPPVWEATVASLLAITGVLLLYSMLIDDRGKTEGGIEKTIINAGILLGQCIEFNRKWSWWERLVLGLWMLMTLVLAKSYAGNLMSLLAVRYVPQPFQSLEDVLNDPRITMIWHKDSSPAQYIFEAKGGIFYEVRKTIAEGRVKFLYIKDYPPALEDVRRGSHVIVDFDVITTTYNMQGFSLTGACHYYFGRKAADIQRLAMISQKDNPILLAINKRQAMIVVLLGGQAFSIFLLCLETLHARLSRIHDEE
ncbi:glutamate receptor ionotropic, delta-1-like [Eriocheir sinensis]|uniref:glutamate receptor ionotropic, delta-1-like n=1 Tax=Eriocheir sinensis TaxID=95602 RepID=UPI0021C68024|nr:glutamate receptor ionotropic, delta-1-like [Eriocheir sinensis]